MHLFSFLTFSFFWEICPFLRFQQFNAYNREKKRSNPCFDMMINYKSKGVNKLNYKKNNRQFIYFKSLFLFFNQFCIINIHVCSILCIGHIHLSILIKHESCLSVCLSVRVFRSHQKSQGHEILALGLIWANLKHDEARFSKKKIISNFQQIFNTGPFWAQIRQISLP